MKTDCPVQVSALLDDPEWDAFVAGFPGGHHVQTSRWARVKSTLGWRAVRITARNSGEIRGGAQMLIRTVPVLGCVGYVSKGPLCYGHDSVLAGTVLDEIIEAGRTNSCRLLAVQPPDNGEHLCGILESRHFRESRLELSPTASLVIDLKQAPEKILAGMKRETRHHIHRSERAGIVVREGDKADLDIFYPLYLITARRQGFLPFHRDYFETLWQTFFPFGWIALLIASFEDEPVSAQLLIPFGKTVIAKMVGWSGKHSKARPNDALFWASILWAHQRGYEYFDFEGLDPKGARAVVEGRADPGAPNIPQDIIKYGYGGEVLLFPAVYDYLPNRVLNLAYHCMARAVGAFPMPVRLVEYLRKRK